MQSGDRLGVTRFATPSDNEIVVTRLVEAPREQVFDAWTKPEQVKRWMLGPDGYTMPVCEIDLRVGGTWHFVWRGPGGNEVGMRGEYRDVAPPERLVSTEHWGDPWPETLNAFDFSEEDDGTTDHLHRRLPDEGGARRGARDGHEGRHERQLHPSRRVPRVNATAAPGR